MEKKSAEDYLDKLLDSVNDENDKNGKFKETAKMLEDAMSFWDTDFPDSEKEDAEYGKISVKEERKSEQEDKLDALLSSAKNAEFGMNRRRTDGNQMYSRRVSKSEAEFLKEFEAELTEEENLDDLFAEFEMTIGPKDRLELEDIRATELDEIPLDEVSLDEVSLDEIPLDNVSLDEIAPMSEEVPLEMSTSLSDFAMASEPVPMDEIPDDVFAELFGENGELNLAEMPQEMQTEEEGLDLGNLGDEDLMNLLAGAEGLEDIGDMLNKGEITDISDDEIDAFSVFAESEMSEQQISAEPAIEEENLEKKKEKKAGLLGKIKGFVGSLLKSYDDDEVELKSGKTATVEVLSGENADILAELESLEEKPSKKDKKKKEKKEKKKKEKKPKQPKQPKAPKPKKEKKPKEVDNTPALPKGPVFMIWLMIGSMVALVLLCVNIFSYNSAIADAKSLENQGHYAEAFTALNGLEIKEKDLEMYSKLAILATVDSELNAYEVFADADAYDKAFDSLICAAGRCHINREDAEKYGCIGQLEILKKSVSNELQEKYNMTYEEAIEMYTIRFRDDYTIALYKKLTELGIEWE